MVPTPLFIQVSELQKLVSVLPASVQTLPIETFDLTVRLANVFVRENIKTLQDISILPAKDICKWSGLGVKSVTQFIETLNQLELPTLEQKIESAQREAEASFACFSQEQELQEEIKDQPFLKLLLKKTRHDYDWLEGFLESFPEHAASFSSLGIVDERTFVVRRAKLEKKIQIDADGYRFRHIAADKAQTDPIGLIVAAPLWLLEMDIYFFDCDTRNKNFLRAFGVSKLQDLLEYSSSDLVGARNMGRNSLIKLHQAIIAAFVKGPPPSDENIHNFDDTLLNSFMSCLDELKEEKYRTVIEHRLGVHAAPKTLDEVGKHLGLTRERIRQIQGKVTRLIINGEFWDDVLMLKLDKILEDSGGAVSLAELGKRDHWFTGFDQNIILLKNLIEWFSHLDVSFLTISGDVYVSKISAAQWDEIQETILDSFEYNLHMRYSIDDVEILVEGELARHGIKGLSRLMFDAIYPSLVFSQLGGELLLTGIGNSKIAYIKAILEESDIPLHYSEVAKRYEQKYGISKSPRNIHAGLNHGGFLIFDRGTYGLMRHLQVSKFSQQEFVLFSEHLVSSNPEKQWHSETIINEFKKQDTKNADIGINKYIANILLQSSRLCYLGKSIWIDKQQGDSDTERLHIKKAVADILRDAGKPIKSEEIHSKIVEVRSVGSNFLTNLHPNELYSRVDPGTWGLLDRDFILAPRDWQPLKNYLLEGLDKAGEGLHSSEVLPFLAKLDIPNNITSGHVLGVISADNRFRIWRGSFISPAAWPSPNRILLSEGVEQIAAAEEGDFSTDGIMAKLQILLRYPFEKYAVSLALNRLGYKFDRDTDLWCKQIAMKDDASDHSALNRAQAF